ncbi:MAG: DUF1028 domain-containing protein [Anaerolineae bacterium]|nr:DUF1028 domain-containing protein [Anaerolineae bacterium]
MEYHQLFATYSIAARDPETGALGVAVQTHQIGVGRMVPFLLPGVGAVATQSLVNVSFGPLGLQFLREGYAADRTLAALVASDAEAARRQVAVVDRQGNAAAHTGSGCIPHAAHHSGAGYSVQANMMTRDTVIPAMAAAFERASGDLAARMLAALRAAQVEDGDIRGMQSAALKVVSSDPTSPAWSAIYDLRVDEHAEPLTELGRLVRLRHAQLVDTQGHQALDAGDSAEALGLWAQARAEAPDLEELAFWQALALADQQDDVAGAVAILGPVLAAHPRRAHWIDLITRLGICGFIDHPAAGEALCAALESA